MSSLFAKVPIYGFPVYKGLSIYCCLLMLSVPLKFVFAYEVRAIPEKTPRRGVGAGGRGGGGVKTALFCLPNHPFNSISPDNHHPCN